MLTNVNLHDVKNYTEDEKIYFETVDNYLLRDGAISHSIIYIKFLSHRFLSRTKELEQCLLFLEQPTTDANLTQISESVGSYCISEGIQKKLIQKKLSFDRETGKIPYTAPIDFVSPAHLKYRNKKSFTINEIKEFTQKNNLSPSGWCWGSSEQNLLSNILHARGNFLDFWQVLDAMDILVSHKQAFLKISFNSNRVER